MCKEGCNCTVPCANCTCKNQSDGYMVSPLDILECFKIPGCINEHDHDVRFGNAMILAVSSRDVAHEIAKIFPVGCCRPGTFNDMQLVIVGACDECGGIDVLRNIYHTVQMNGGFLDSKLINDSLLTKEDVVIFGRNEKIALHDFDLKIECSAFDPAFTKIYTPHAHSCR